MFDSNVIGKAYSQDRPYIHPVIIEKIKRQLNLSKKVEYALDVGCGTGLSTLALKEVAENIVGVDSSKSMINCAIKDDNIKYYNYSAEHLPFEKKFDLITLGGSINWIDRVKFFTGAKKILREEGVVVVYDNYMLGMMEENDRFETWYTDKYLTKYPKPPRDESSISNEEATKYGFEQINSETYTNKVKFTLDNFIKYLFSQSNIVTLLNNQKKDRESIRKWFISSLISIFGSGEKRLIFGGYIWYLKILNGE
ncbi:MAG: class I SAM-dependent methyltransferase [bacterium]|nr:class I SAM-dependent methyltransferase [bacterium]